MQQQLGDRLLVGIHHGHPEARLEIGCEPEIQRQIRRVDAARGRHVGDRLLLETRVGCRELGFIEIEIDAAAQVTRGASELR